ncbi:S8 family serine peptidase [Myceligenerans salitolerans]|uniref:alpha-amylase n=1 Tax=Myceligenerans salitolerans TaxID=1230528 RepID=A0ABS3IBC9_9MICO|nr:S8 family serine peptidase [Myceligenerans salitolerans]MBO0610250.1 carboxypeptidase regulatory-like domain-containing protein [Myceligenerans salitolerans]
MKLTAVVASLALTAGLGVIAPLPMSAAAPPPEPAAEAPEPDDKIEPALQESFRQDPTAEFWLRFENHADLEPARSITDWTERGQFVYDALTETAQESLATVSAELDDAGVEYESFPIVNAVLVKGGTEDLALELAENQQVAEVHETPEVKLVEPVRPEPDAPAVRAAESDVEWGLEYINAPEAWELGATGAGITVSNLDSGVQFDHPALVESYRGTNPDGTSDHDYNWFTTRGGCGDVPCDDNGHGTHTMGTMVGDDGTGNQVGVAPDAQWIATNGCCEEAGFQTLLDSGWWLLAPTDLAGENPDVSKRPHVVNNSWGSSGEHAFSDFFTAIDEAWTAAGIFSVWSSGNTSPAAACDTVSSPGSHPDAYSVGAFASNGVLAAFSRKGEGEDGAIKPEIAAPGVSVRSAWPGNGYNTISGTSMAAPHVAGAVAALWSYDPTLVGQIDRTRRLLAESAVDVDDTSCGGTAEFNNKYGEGRLDLVRLLQLAPREGGSLTGVVTAGGEPVAGAEVTIDGPFHRTVGTTQDGSFSVHLPEGDYALTTTAFGYVRSSTDATVTVGEDTALDIVLTTAPTHDVSGTVLGEDEQPVPEAEVSIGGTPLDPVRTGDDGRFTIPDVPEGEYALDVRPNACFSPTTVPLTVGPQTDPAEVPVARVVDEGGYTCAVSEGEYRRGTQKVEYPSGIWAQVPLPSPITLYNGTHDTLNIGRRGVISVDDTIAGPGHGGAGVFPFYTASPLRTDTGGVYTASTTVDGEDAFVVEYRDMVVWGGTNWPRESEGTVSFSATFTRSGKVIVAYGDGVGGDDPLTAGLVTTTGIQGWEGVDGIRFSENAPVLHDGLVVTYDLPDFGYLDTTVTDRNDGLPVEGATVAISDADGLVESLTTTSTGALRRQLPVGDYTMTVSAPDYVTESHEFSVDELYDRTTVEARLATGVADLAADGLDAVLGTDQNGSGSLTLTNTGSAPVTYDLGEAERHPELDADDATARTSTGADSAIDLTAWNEAAAAARGQESSAAEGPTKDADAVAAAADEMGTHSGGDVITRIPIPGDPDEKEPTGLGYDGDVWVHDYEARTNTAYTVTGASTGKEFAAGWNPDYRAFDLAFDSRTGEMCQMEDSPASFIHCFDPDTGEKTREIAGAWSNTQLTGLAYDANRDVFYVGGRGVGAIGTVAGTSHETPGEFLSYCSPPLPEVMGLAYNETSDTVWYSDRAVNRPSRLLQVDPADCSLVNAWWFPGRLLRQGGGLATDATGALWATDQVADEVLLVDVEDDLLTDLPWLSLSATGGTLAPGETTTVDVTLSADDLEPGVLGGNIVVTSDAGRQSKEYVPVTLTTTEFQVGVNAGGPAYTDEHGFDWSADQKFDDGSWGYQGRTRRAWTHRSVDATADDALFRSQRTTWRKDLRYEFDDVPEGTYLVDLGFAEIGHVAPGRRVFDVLVDDSLVRYAYDAAGRVGRNTADWQTAVVEHSGGPLTVELRGALGLRPPSLAALRVTLDPRAAETPAPEPEQPEPEEVPVAPADRSYTVAETTNLYRQGTTNTGWSGRLGCGVLWFGFDFPFYDTSWDGVCVAMNGMLTFDRSRTMTANTELPTRSPADAIYPFWDDLVVDDEAGIYVGVTEVDGLDAQIIEYRDVTFYDEPSERVSFSVTLVADGRIQLGYGDGFGGENPRTHGASATVGVERLDGLRAQQYSFDEPVLTAGTGLEYVLPASGTIEGEVTDANDGEPVAGAIVTLTADDGSSRTITANAQGLWKAQALVGDHTVEVRSPHYETVADTVTIAARDQAEVFDTALATGVAEISGDELEWLLGPDGTASSELTVTNTGSAPMEVELTEQSRDEDGDPEPADLPWLAMSGDAADETVELGVGESTTVTVAVDNAGADPGLLVGDVLVSSTAGRSPEQYERVRMATSAYWLGIDVGGRGHVGTDGFVWSADRAFRPDTGGWGHVGGTKRATRGAIDGTEDDDLFRTQRTGRTFRYVLEDVPQGGYRIDLGFAEFSRLPLGTRSFDVLVNGEVVLYEYDVRAEAGVLTADERSTTVEHPGGDLTVELIGETGKRHPILSSLAVLEDPRL